VVTERRELIPMLFLRWSTAAPSGGPTIWVRRQFGALLWRQLPTPLVPAREYSPIWGEFSMYSVYCGSSRSRFNFKRARLTKMLNSAFTSIAFANPVVPTFVSSTSPRCGLHRFFSSRCSSWLINLTLSNRMVPDVMSLTDRNGTPESR